MIKELHPTEQVKSLTRFALSLRVFSIIPPGTRMQSIQYSWYQGPFGANSLEFVYPACSGVSALHFAKNRALYEQGVRGESEHNAASFVGRGYFPADRSSFELLRDECEDVEESGDFPTEGHMYMLLL